MGGGRSGSGDQDGELKLTRSQGRVVVRRCGCRVQLLLTPFLAECSHKFESYGEDMDHHVEGELSREENIVLSWTKLFENSGLSSAEIVRS